MAQRRMFSLGVVHTDRFLELPVKTQCLYFHLGMMADDEGFVSSPRMIASMVGCGAKDLDRLVENDYLIRFESGVCVIRDWKMQNKVQPSRIVRTQYKEELSRLCEDENGSYHLLSAVCQQTADNLPTQVRLV